MGIPVFTCIEYLDQSNSMFLGILNCTALKTSSGKQYPFLCAEGPNLICKNYNFFTIYTIFMLLAFANDSCAYFELP